MDQSLELHHFVIALTFEQYHIDNQLVVSTNLIQNKQHHTVCHSKNKNYVFTLIVELSMTITFVFFFFLSALNVQTNTTELLTVYIYSNIMIALRQGSSFGPEDSFCHSHFSPFDRLRFGIELIREPHENQFYNFKKIYPINSYLSYYTHATHLCV